MVGNAGRRSPSRLAKPGMFALLFGFALAPILGLAGAAVDLAAAHMARARLQSALDSAVLAAAR